MHTLQDLCLSPLSHQCQRPAPHIGCLAKMQHSSARSMLCPGRLAVRHSCYSHWKRSAFARHHTDSPACPLRAPTLHCAATSLAQGQISIDAPSCTGQLQSGDFEDSLQTLTHRKSVTEGRYRNGYVSSQNGEAASSNGTVGSSAHLQSSGAASSSAEALQTSSTSDGSAQDSLDLELNRERSLSSSSKAETNEKFKVPAAGAAQTMQGDSASSQRLPDKGSTSAKADYVPPKELLKRLRERPDGSLDERERLRRNRISAANKGRKPWNQGMRHKPGELRKWQLHACSGQI